MMFQPQSQGYGGMSPTYRPPPQVAWRDTKAAMNNQIASGDRAAATHFSAGQGLSSGRGQQYMQSMRGGAAQAGAMNNAMGLQLQDAYSNANAQQAYQSGYANEQLSYQRMDEQRRQGQLDSRFNNLTSIWGALSGLLR